MTAAHVRRWREHRGNTGQGHLYQGRFKSVMIEEDHHFLTVMRYVEANPLRAGMAQQAKSWHWSSLGGAPGSDPTRLQLANWPVDKPADWPQRANESWEDKLLEQLRVSVARDRPYGDDRWTARVAKRHGLESTLRDPWRPSKSQKVER